ncbi:MAG: M14 family zinc carboxypeptidase [Candidatus Gracilibacteria bacterium]|nr:M14 family zinc carboxypeptidase [Candidatus Gracilibacteria bacterium]
MKKILIIFIILIIPQIGYGYENNIENLQINIKNNIFSGQELQSKLNNLVSKTLKNNIEKQNLVYSKLSIELDKILEKKEDTNINNIKKVIDFLVEKTNKELDIYYKKIKKITLGYSENGYPIYAYYSGNPNDGYFGIFADIHGGYEYGTYETAVYLVKEFENAGITGWFIIPSINPEGLEYYKNKTINYDAFIKGRVNNNNIDLNRNFCSKNFELKTFIKNGEYIDTGVDRCESESETRVIVETLKKYKFNKIISLHSEGNIFYIPDNSIDDNKIKDFGNQISQILPTYQFNLDYNNEFSKNQKIKEYEINEGGESDFTGTMETYIYENYNIPVILIELDKHGKLEYRLKGLIELIKK